ncbi:hypothetical protein BJV77DRAFT_972520 [Russula vinacea]|nr:hypothetical protein BJV77DRAFT_972520 [Russula vinacea]
MASSTRTPTRTPPPTTNKLDAVQRARVMRYSRKLGALLGTTPCLLESCGSTVPATLCPASRRRHQRQRSVLDNESRTSSESLPLPRLSHVGRPLVLSRRPVTPRPLIYLDAVPLSSSNPRVQATTHLTRSSSLDIPPTPTTPMQPSSVEARRRKMARVMRTLGEKVPPELVFQASDKVFLENYPVSDTMLLDTRPGSRTRSAHAWQRDVLAPVFSSGSKAPDDQRWVGEWNRRNMAQVQNELRALRR